MIEINWLWLIVSYLLACTAGSVYLMFWIYLPVVEEVKFIVEDRFGVSSLGKTKRFSFFYGFVAFILGIVFAPYLLGKLSYYGFDSVLNSYKNQFWLDVRKEILAAGK